MSTWGPGAFDNDDAMDWLTDAIEADSPALVREALQAAMGAQPERFQQLFGARGAGKPLKADTANAALAAAALVAAVHRRDTATLPYEAVAWVGQWAELGTPAMVALARAAVGRVRLHSKLADQWAKSKDAGAWLAGLTQLQARLGA